MKTETTHAKASPSDYRRWSNCIGALQLEAKLDAKGLLPADESSPAAEEGTRLHALAESALLDPNEKWRDEWIEYANLKSYVNFCIGLEGTKHVETQVSLFYSPDETGTVDFASHNGNVLHIVDLKTGNHPVSAEGNKQLLIYALGLVLPETEIIRMTIFQFGEPDTWELSVDDAQALGVLIGEMASVALNDEVTALEASDEACKWCRCKGYCPAFAKPLIESFDDLTSGERLSDAKMAHIFSQKTVLTKMLSEIEKNLFARVSGGEHIDGLHVEAGRKGNKAWSKDVDPVTVMLAAGIPTEDAVVSKPITPTQALKLAPTVEGWMQPEGRPTLKAGDVVCPSEAFDIL